MAKSKPKKGAATRNEGNLARQAEGQALDGLDLTDIDPNGLGDPEDYGLDPASLAREPEESRRDIDEDLQRSIDEPEPRKPFEWPTLSAQHRRNALAPTLIESLVEHAHRESWGDEYYSALRLLAVGSDAPNPTQRAVDVLEYVLRIQRSEGKSEPQLRTTAWLLTKARRSLESTLKLDVRELTAAFLVESRGICVRLPGSDSAPRRLALGKLLGPVDDMVLVVRAGVRNQTWDHVHTRVLKSLDSIAALNPGIEARIAAADRGEILEPTTSLLEDIAHYLPETFTEFLKTGRVESLPYFSHSAIEQADATSPNERVAEPQVVQVGTFRKTLARVLDAASAGQPYRIAAHGEVRADLVSYDPEVHHPNETVTRRALREGLNIFLKRAGSDEVIRVRKRGDDGPGVVLVRAPVDPSPLTDDDRRKRERERGRQRRGRSNDEITKRHRELALGDRERKILEITDSYTVEELLTLLANK